MSTETEIGIWNRAATNGGGPTPRRGDVALAAVISFHGMVMSGGLDHALEVLDPAAVAAAIDGFRYLEALDVAELVRDGESFLATDDDEAIELANRRYDELVPTDARLSELATMRIRSAPDDFNRVEA